MKPSSFRFPEVLCALLLGLAAGAVAQQPSCTTLRLSSYATRATDIIGVTGVSAVGLGVPDYRFVNDFGLGFGGTSNDAFDAGEVVELAFPAPLQNIANQHDAVLSAFVGGLGATDDAHVQVEASSDGSNFTIIQTFNTSEARNRAQDLWENNFEGVKHFYLEFGALNTVTHVKLTNLASTSEGLRLDSVEGLHPVVDSTHAFEVRLERVREDNARRFKVRLKNIGLSTGVPIREWRMDRTRSIAALQETTWPLKSVAGDFICFENCIPDNHPTVIPYSRHVWSLDGLTEAPVGLGLDPGRQAAHERYADFDTDGGVAYLASFRFTVVFADGFVHTFDYDTDTFKEIGSLYQQYLYYSSNPAQSWNRPVDYYQFSLAGPGPQWQVNTSNAHLDIDGVLVPASSGPPAVVNKLAGERFDLTMQSVGQPPFEAVITTRGVVPAASGGATTPGGQFLNLDLAGPDIYFLNGVYTPLLIGFPGNFTATIPTPNVECSLSIQAAFLIPGVLDGLALTQASELHLVANACAAATPLAMGDDASIVQSLGFGYPFYGTTYTEVYVGSNGYLTFGAPETGHNPAVAALRSGPPRMAACFRNLTPNVQGTISFYTDGTDVFSACWSDVAQASSPGSSTFSITARASAQQVIFDYGTLQAFAPIVGMAPGGGSGTLYPVDLTAGPMVIGPTDVPYEAFSSHTDLSHRTLIWTLLAGQPVLLQ